jgi:hypothetical protein
MGEVRNTHRITMGTLNTIRLVGISRRKMGDNIKVWLRHTVEFDVYWMYVAQDRDKWQAVVNTAMNPRFQ